MALSTPAVVASAPAAVAAAVTTSAFTPTPGALVVAVSVSTGSTASNGQGSISSTHGDLTWNVGGVTGGGTSQAAVRWFWAQAGAAPASGTVTINSGGAPTIHDVAVIELTGHDPAAAIYGSASQSTVGGTTLTGTLSVAPAATDGTIGLAVNRNKTTAPTPGSGFVAIDSAATASPSASYLIEWRTDSTSTTVVAGNVGTQYAALQAFNVAAAPTAPPAFSGSASMSGSGVLSAVGAVAVAAVVALTGSGAVAASGTPSVARPATLAGTGTVTATGSPAASGAAQLAGAGTLTAAGFPATASGANLSGGGSLAATGVPRAAAAASLTGAGQLTALNTSASALAALGGTGTLTASGRPATSGAAALGAVGTLTATGRPAASLTVSMAGAGAVAAASTPSPTAVANLYGFGSLAASGSGAEVVDVVVLGFNEKDRTVAFSELANPEVAFIEHERAVLFTERQRTITCQEDLVKLHPAGREFYDPGPQTEPAVTGWQASFDGGVTWHDPTDEVDGRPRWLLAGPSADPTGAVAVVTSTMRPMLRATGVSPEVVIARAPAVRVTVSG